LNSTAPGSSARPLRVSVSMAEGVQRWPRSFLCCGLPGPHRAADPVSEVGASRLSVIVNGNVLRIPYYRNLALSGSYPQVDRAAVMVHGTNRNASHAYDNLVDAATRRRCGPTATVLLSRPVLTEEDISAHGLAADMLFWSEQGWKDGAHSRTPCTPDARTASVGSRHGLDPSIGIASGRI